MNYELYFVHKSWIFLLYFSSYPGQRKWNNHLIYPFQRRRCCVFDSPGLPNDSAGYLGLAHGSWGTTSQEEINAEGVVRLIAQGWRQPTLGYACSEEVNAVGVVRFLSGISQ